MEADLGDAVPIVLFLCIAAVIITPIVVGTFYRNRERERLHQTVRVMIENGHPPSPEALEGLNLVGQARPPTRGDLRRGAIVTAVGLSIAAFGWLIDCRPLIGVAALPFFLGVAFIVLGLVSHERAKV